MRVGRNGEEQGLLKCKRRWEGASGEMERAAGSQAGMEGEGSHLPHFQCIPAPNPPTQGTHIVPDQRPDGPRDEFGRFWVAAEVATKGGGVGMLLNFGEDLGHPEPLKAMAASRWELSGCRMCMKWWVPWFARVTYI